MSTLCLSLAFALLHLGQYAEALVECEKAIALKPDRALAYYIRGQTMARLEQYDDAIADYDKAIALKPDDAFVYHNRGSAKQMLGQYSGALADYDKAIELNPDHGPAYFSRGSFKYSFGLYHIAIADYDETIRLRPKPYGYAFRGMAKGELGHMEEAKEDFQTALKLAEESGDESLKAFIESAVRTRY